MVLAQEYINQNYPVKERGSITKLFITPTLPIFFSTALEGNLDLSDFVNLEYFSCSVNELTNIDLSKNIKLKEVSVFGNKISADLSIFSHLINLQKLDLGLKEGSSNDFYGSLKALENCKQLEYLCIGQNKKITEGLEYLPTENLTHFGCHGTIFEEILKPYGLGREGLKLWKLTNQKIITLTTQKNQLEQNITNFKTQITNLGKNISDLERQKRSLTAERNQLQKSNIDFKQTETKLNEEISTITNEKNVLVKKLAELERLRNEAAERIKSHKLIGTPKEEELAGKYRELSELFEHQNSIIKSFDTEKNAFAETYENLEADKKALKENRDKVANERDNLKKELVKNSNILKEKEAELKEKVKNLSSLRDQKNNDDQQLKSGKLEIQKLTAEISEAKKKITDLTSELKDREGVIENLKAEITTKKEEIKALNQQMLTEQRKKNWALLGSSVQGITTELLGDKWGKRANSTIQVVSGAALLSNMGEWTYEVWLMGIGIGIFVLVPKLYRALAPAVEKWTGIELPGAKVVEKIKNAKEKVKNSLDQAEQKAINVVVNLGEQIKNQTDKLIEPNPTPAESKKEEVKGNLPEEKPNIEVVETLPQQDKKRKRKKKRN